MKKWLVGLLMSLTLVFALAACSDGDDGNANGNNNGDGGDSDHFDQMKEDGKATIGFADEKPYAYEEDGELRSEEHTSELQSRFDLVCRLLLEKKKIYASAASQ